jgi:hypothetical protein
LLPPQPDSPRYLPDNALLPRKDLVAVSREALKKWNQPGVLRSGVRLPLGVTVTRVRPDAMNLSGVTVLNQRFFIPFEIQTQQDGSAGFFFPINEYPTLVDPAMILMPWTADAQPYSITDQHIEDALMTTSAFPRGFGRKRLQYCRKQTLSGENDATEGAGGQMSHAKEGELVCPGACRQMAFNIGSDFVVLGGAIGTAGKYELYRELTSDNWQLNLTRAHPQMANLLDISVALNFFSSEYQLYACGKNSHAP